MTLRHYTEACLARRITADSAPGLAFVHGIAQCPYTMIADAALQLMGAHGVRVRVPLSAWLRAARRVLEVRQAERELYRRDIDAWCRLQDGPPVRYFDDTGGKDAGSVSHLL